MTARPGGCAIVRRRSTPRYADWWRQVGWCRARWRIPAVGPRRVGCGRRIWTSPNASRRSGHGRTAACCSRPSTPCSGTARVSRGCSASIRCSRSSSRRHAGPTATTACPCSQESVSWRGSTSGPTAGADGWTCCRAGSRSAQARLIGKRPAMPWCGMQARLDSPPLRRLPSK